MESIKQVKVYGSTSSITEHGIEFDIHYQIDSKGSRKEFIK